MNGEEIIYNKDHVKLTKTPTVSVESEAIIKYFTKELTQAADIKKESPLGFWYIKHIDSSEIPIKHYLVISKDARYEISYPNDLEYIPIIDTETPGGSKLLSSISELIKLMSARGITRVTELYKGTVNISPKMFKRELYTKLFRIDG